MKMKWNLVHVTLKDGAVAETREIYDDILFDFDEKGEVLGVEFLSARKIEINGKEVM